MIRRHAPIGSRHVTAVGRAIRACADAVGSASAIRRDESTANRSRQRREAWAGRLEDTSRTATGEAPGEDSDAGAADGGPTDDESDGGSSIANGAVDPDDGPTSRAEILEYGLTPAEYVRAVLVEHGGRIKQQRFIDRYGWSRATLSRLLSDLEGRDVVERYRIGREKIVCLPAAVPDSVC
ncbi:MarR family transcriptional regulator [Natrinema versiforme]|uniref:MarR family transcriptional regulator n=1 Tax=Natrinema versiforme TaxID=88724 RepID=A0A4V1FZH6_9EURY|nr:MarR family transcriptional regulator [Natrinema versiforme]QCS41876.1 MarR family transcriptional regulator [Natrinema versiforme]